MERDIFIISVYRLVVEIMQKIETTYKFRRTGFPPKLTDSEVITIEICGEFFKLHEDTEIYHYFKRHYLDYFPNLPERARPLSDKRLICGKPNYYAGKCWLPKRAHHSLRGSQLTQCRCRFALTPEAANVINALPPSPMTVIAPPKRWITTASNLDSECRVPV